MFRLLAGLAVAISSLVCSGQQSSGESIGPLAFRPISLTSMADTFWLAGAGGGVASSVDGQHWTTHHLPTPSGPLLLGITFNSPLFGYAYGTNGTLLVTSDGGATWEERHLTTEDLLLVALADATHGIVRTSSALHLLSGASSLTEIQQDALKRFRYTPSLVALSADRMAALVAEGPYAEAGFLSTVDGGHTWSFYDPPSSGIASFVRAGDKYWAVGHEVVDKDKPGGGHSVPLAIGSDDARTWVHSTAGINACHWHGCSRCTANGCLASSTRIVDPFASPVVADRVSNEPIGSDWAVVKDTLCSVQNGTLACETLHDAGSAQEPGDPPPTAMAFPPLGTARAHTGLLQCIRCSVDPVFVSHKQSGRVAVQFSFIVNPDGTVSDVVLKGTPDDAVQAKLQKQISSWLFTPPLKDGHPARVSTGSSLTLNLVQPR